MNLNIEKKCLEIDEYSIPFLEIKGQIWFRGNDVAKFLQYKDPATTISRKVDSDFRKMYSELGVVFTSTPLHPNELNARWISEPGLYSLIMSSKQTDAKRFQRWVYSEVLPTIRQQGHYHVGQSPKPKTEIPSGRVSAPKVSLPSTRRMHHSSHLLPINLVLSCTLLSTI